MKYSTSVSSSRRKSRKAHLTSHSEARRKIMSAHVSKDIKDKFGVRAVPLRKDDEVTIVRGKYVGREGKVTSVYRKKFVITVERIQKEKANGQSVPVTFHPSNVVITKLKTTYKDRKEMLDRKKAGREARLARGSAMDEVDA